MSSTYKLLVNGTRAVGGLLMQKLSGRRIPVRVSLLITKRCNLRCFYCYAKDVLNSKDVCEPTIDDLKNILDEIHACGCRWVEILGGEPLLRDDIGEFVDYATSKKMFLSITTNGYFVKKRIDTLKKMNHVCISLDGDKESNDHTRGDGSFERIVEGIDCAIAHGLKVRVHATLSKRSMSPSSLKFLSDFCRARKTKLNYSENGLPGIEQLDPDFLLSPEETLAFYRSYRRLKREGFPIVSSDVAVEYAARWPLPGATTIYKKDVSTVPRNSYYPCALGRNQCFISADGNVYACTKKWGYGKNLYEVGFKAAWDFLADLDCVACKELGTIEQSLITKLQPRAIVNAALNFSL